MAIEEERAVIDTGILRVHVQPRGDEVVVGLVGELDLASSGELSTTLAELAASGRDVVVDLADLRFIDSTGMAALLRARGTAEANGCMLVLRKPHANVARTLALAALDTVFQLQD